MNLSLIPQPRRLRRLKQHPFNLTAATVIVAPPGFSGEAKLLAARLRQATGWRFPVRSVPPRKPAIPLIRLRQASAALSSREAYVLRVTAKEVTITASAPAGAFYGSQSLLQLFPPAVFGESPRPEIIWTAPAVEIADAPRFPWRGVMIDSARYFQPISYLEKFIDLLSQHKFNVFHWHLVDDQGWRIEMKYPRLTSIGSRRRETVRGHRLNKLGGDGVPVEGYYSQTQIRALVAYAAARHVQILPEIEMPGHAQAAIAAYPKLGLLPRAREVSCTWGIHETLFNTKPATFAFLQDVLTEVIALFPFRYLHIGGDEAVKKQWKNDSPTQTHMRTLGLVNEEQLQSWFIRKIEAFLRRNGRRLVGWDEILEGGLAKTATVMSWRGIAGAIAAARLGNDAIMCPHQSLYFNFHETRNHAAEPLGYPRTLPLAKVHAYEPVPATLTRQQARHIIGVQGQLWTEYIPTTSQLDYMAFPRIAALADVAWCPRARPRFAHFLRRLGPHGRRLDCQNVRYRAPLEYIRP